MCLTRDYIHPHQTNLQWSLNQNAFTLNSTPISEWNILIKRLKVEAAENQNF